MGDFWESKSIASPQTRDADVAKPREDGTRVRRPGGGRKPEKPRAAAAAAATAEGKLGEAPEEAEFGAT